MEKVYYDYLALALMVIGSLNWGLVGLFNFNLVEFICQGNNTLSAKLIYIGVGIAGLYFTIKKSYQTIKSMPDKEVIR